MNPSHELSPYAGFRDPIAENIRSRLTANAMQTLNATLGRFMWDRGSGSEGEADPRTNVAEECGWPANPSAQLLMFLYQHDSIAARVVEFMPKQAWQVQPKLMEGDKVEGTPLLDSWWELNSLLRGGEMNGYRPKVGHALFSDLKLVDILSGINHYGILYLALDDGLDPVEPAAGLEEYGSRPNGNKERERRFIAVNGSGEANHRYRLVRNAEQVKGRRLISTLPLPELLAPVAEWETNENSPRYGQPVSYTVTQIDSNMSWSGSTPPLRTRTVHWTRVIHYADWTTHASTNKVLANPRMQVTLPEILDGRKISGADGMAYWRNAMLKIFLESNPSLGGDVLFNKNEARDDFENMMNGQQQWMFLRGLHANPVAPTLVDPSPHQKAKIERICIKNGWPVRIFIGSERGELASSQDEIYHKENVRQHENDYESPSVIAPTVNRLVMVGVLEQWGKDGYNIEWPDVGTQDPLKQAQVFGARMAAFAAASQQTILDERNVLVREAGFEEEDADAILDAMEEKIMEEEEAAAEAAEAGQAEGQQPPPFGQKEELEVEESQD